jgi:hypothetical protein
MATISTTSTADTTVLADQYYTSKYGRIAILTGDNYPIFQQTCRTALIVANAWGITSGTENRPAGNRAAEYDERLRKAIQLISSSVAPYLQNKISALVQNSDPAGMWTELAKENRALDQIYQDALVNQFAKEAWSPQTETLRVYINRLDSYRTKLTGTDNEVSEAQMRTRLLQSLPDTTLWNQAKHFCLYERRDWNSTVALLQSYEKPPSSAAVSMAVGQRSNGRTKPSSKWKKKKETKSMDRKPSSNKIDKDQCRFCHNRGHFQAECRLFKKAQAAVLKGKEDKKDTDEERVNIVTVDQADENHSTDTTAEYAKSVFDTENWVVDSGATRHFSSYRGDFRSIKRWSTPKTVRVADGTAYKVEGYGPVTVKTSAGSYELDEVWYAPDLGSRLVSTSILNDRGVSVILENRML